MIIMALLSVIRRWNFRYELPIREIELRTGLELRHRQRSAGWARSCNDSFAPR